MSAEAATEIEVYEGASAEVWESRHHRADVKIRRNMGMPKRVFDEPGGVRHAGTPGGDAPGSISNFVQLFIDRCSFTHIPAL